MTLDYYLHDEHRLRNTTSRKYFSTPKTVVLVPIWGVQNPFEGAKPPRNRTLFLKTHTHSHTHARVRAHTLIKVVSMAVHSVVVLSVAVQRVLVLNVAVLSVVVLSVCIAI